ncbi:ATP synthase F1 subunit gamma [Candidatus Kaiserbacteria bacterium]|nr:ATP synthase F1 subunit gamma [Candidatus Kaiserbacteria bacterium]
MASLKNIKLKIQSVKKTSTVTRAMEAVSAVKMRKSQQRALSGRMYAAVALSILERLAGATDFGNHPLMKPREGKTAFVVVTSDKGLAGSLNSAVIRKTEGEILGRNLNVENVVIIGIGKRGADYFGNRGYEVRERLTNVSDDVSEENVRKVTDSVLSWHEAGEIGAAYIVYTNFLSTFEQEAVARQIVPIARENFAEMIAHIRPVKGKYAPDPREELPTASPVYTVEPDTDAIITTLLPRLLNVAVFHGLLESKASEHSARMVAMKNATDNAKERVKEYTRTFNKIRQASITREISEITSGIEAMK